MQDIIRTSEAERRSEFDHVAMGVKGMRIVMVNVFAIAESPGSWTLVDAGLYWSANRIRRWAARHFGEGVRPSSILLTHGHFDHVGALSDLVKEWDVPVYAHPLEMPYVTGKSEYPPPDPTVGGGAIAAMSWVYPRRPINLGSGVRPLPAGGRVPGLPNWRWIHTPGHTAGHVSFFRDRDRVLIAGDAFVTTKQESFWSVVSQKPELHGPPAYYTSDWDAARLSVQRLADLQPFVDACGHGSPISGVEAASGLRALADNFDEVARPSRGRYVHQPAVTDERGVVALPPPVSTPVPKVLAATAILGVAWLALSYRRRRS
jgi:glyoxylase-like metal-dependent hydrolase (beta-lactamase superfamily II)